MREDGESRATRLLAHHLQRCAEKLWPPVYVGHGLRIGAYIVKFQLKEKGKADRNLLFADEAPKIDIIPLDTDVIARRMIVRFPRPLRFPARLLTWPNRNRPLFQPRMKPIKAMMWLRRMCPHRSHGNAMLWSRTQQAVVCRVSPSSLTILVSTRT